MVTEFDQEIKAKLSDGVWKTEPDYQHWVDEETGLDCLIVRQSNSGHLCGYVGVPKNHPLYGINYSECSLPEARVPNAEEIAQHHIEQMKFYTEQLGYTLEKAIQASSILDKYWTERKRCSNEWCEHRPESFLKVHGGLTYSAECHGRICHKTDNGDHVWWFGFDCAHLGDKTMFTKKYERINLQFSDLHKDDTYRDINYVMNECKELAKQLKEYNDNARIT